jgi:DNA-binding NarL/FixJ family response regulator
VTRPKVLIVDDEPLARRELVRLLAAHPEVPGVQRARVRRARVRRAGVGGAGQGGAARLQSRSRSIQAGGRGR